MAEANQPAAGTGRAPGWVVTDPVEVIFAPDLAGRGYHHIATVARALSSTQEVIAGHNHPRQ